MSIPAKQLQSELLRAGRFRPGAAIRMPVQDFLWTIFSWICKGFGVLAIISIVVFFGQFMWLMMTNGGRKWYYYNPSKPWKGGYWTPLLPSCPPYDEYAWNPVTCRFEHKKTGEPLHTWAKPLNRGQAVREKQVWDWDALGLPDDRPMPESATTISNRPEWVRFLFEETPASLWKKHKQRKRAEKLGRNPGRKR